MPIRTDSKELILPAFLSKGQPWPPVNAAKRYERYEFTQALFRGNHREAFDKFPHYKVETQDPRLPETGRQIEITDKPPPYEPIGLPRLIAMAATDLSAGGSVTIRNVSGNRYSEVSARRIFRENNGQILFWHGALENILYGVTIYGIRVGKRHPASIYEEVIWDTWEPWMFIPERDGCEVVAGNLYERVEVDVPEVFRAELSGKITVLKVTRYSRGFIQYLAFHLTSGGDSNAVKDAKTGLSLGRRFTAETINIEGAEMPVDPLGFYVWNTVWADRADKEEKEVESTGIDDLFFRIIPNITIGEDWHGMDEFGMGVDNLFNILNMRMGQINDVLNKFASPRLKIPQRLVQLDETTGHYVFKLGDVIPVTPADKDDVAYLTWDAKLETSLDFIRLIINLILSLTDSNRGILGLEDTGQGAASSPESGRAVRLKMLRSIARAMIRIWKFKAAFAEMLWISQLLERSLKLKIPVKQVEEDGQTVEMPQPWHIRITEAVKAFFTGDKEGFKYMPASYTPERPDVKIKPGIPDDETESIQNAGMKLEKGLIDLKGAVIEANADMDPTEIDELVDRIREEKQSASLQANAPRVAAARRTQPADLNNLANKSLKKPPPPNQPQPDAAKANPQAERAAQQGA